MDHQPRLPGYAEIGWSPAAGRSWSEYSARLATQGARWTADGKNLRPCFDMITVTRCSRSLTAREFEKSQCLFNASDVLECNLDVFLREKLAATPAECHR